MRHLAVVACLAVLGSSADAKPRHHHKHKHHKVALENTADEPVDEQLVDAPSAELTPPQDWHFALGPNMWLSAVDAKVSLGGQMVSTGVDFITVEDHVRLAVPLLAEARYGRWSVVGDLTYAVVDLDGGGTVGPVMVSLNGTVSSLSFEGMTGYRVWGEDDSAVAFEARGGVRYQRTAIAGTIDLDGSPVTSLATVSAGADLLAGARVFVRPVHRVDVIGSADIGVAGSSQLTWSAAADASVRISPHVRASLGWRTMTTESAIVSVVMHGPRASLQLLF